MPDANARAWLSGLRPAAAPNLLSSALVTVSLSPDTASRPATHQPKDRLVALALAVLVVAAGFGARLWLLGEQNVWWDEAFSLHMVRKPLWSMLVDAAHDTHPPLYYLLLKPWIAVAGDTELAARYLSVASGAVSIAAVFAAGRAIAGLPGALVAGSVMALSRLSIWWSQEIRMYALATACIAVAAWGAIRFLHRPGRLPLAAYVVAAALALLSVYVAGAAVAGLGLGAAIALLAGRRWRALALWCGAQAIPLVAVAPWLAVQLQATPTWSGGGESTTATALLRAYAIVLPTGVSDNLERWTVPALLLIGLAAVSVVAGALTRRLGPLLPPLGVLACTPFVIWLLLQPRGAFYQPPFSVRYFVVAAPAFALSLAALPLLTFARSPLRSRYVPEVIATASSLASEVPGRQTRARTSVAAAGALLGVAAVLLSASSLPSYFSSRHRVDDLQSMVTALATHWEPGDHVLLVSGDRGPLWEHAVRHVQPAIEWTGAPWQQPADESSVHDEVEGAVGGAPRVWLASVDSQLLDPQGLVRRELEQRYVPIFDEQFGPNRLTLFADAGSELRAQVPSWLERDLPEPILAADLPVRELRPGESTVITLLVRGPLRDGDYLQLEQAGSGVPGNAIERRRFVDVVPDRLAGQEIVRVPYQLTAHTKTPPGDYEVVAHLAGQRAVLGRLRIAGSALGDAQIGNGTAFGYWRDERASESRLLLVGSEVTAAECEGSTGLSVMLDFRLEQPVSRPYALFVQLVGDRVNPATGNPVWAQHDGQPGGGELPLTQFPTDGRSVREQVCVGIPGELPPGSYRLIAGWYDQTTGERLSFVVNDRVSDHAELWTGTALP